MAHPSVEELLARMRSAREAGGANQASPEQLRRHRELVAACPAFTPNLLELARLLLLTDEPEVDSNQAFAEIQRLLEQAVHASNRSAPALLELAHFMDSIRNTPTEAETIFEESAATALRSLEASWSALINLWTVENRKETLEKALRLSELVEKLFPPTSGIHADVARARNFAAHTGLIANEER
jgi:hypothetical protein